LDHADIGQQVFPWFIVLDDRTDDLGFLRFQANAERDISGPGEHPGNVVFGQTFAFLADFLSIRQKISDLPRIDVSPVDEQVRSGIQSVRLFVVAVGK